MEIVQPFTATLQRTLSNGQSPPAVDSHLSTHPSGSTARISAKPNLDEEWVEGTEDANGLAFSAVWAAMAASGNGASTAGIVGGGRMIAPNEMFETKSGSGRSLEEPDSNDPRQDDVAEADEERKYNKGQVRSAAKNGRTERIADRAAEQKIASNLSNYRTSDLRSDAPNSQLSGVNIDSKRPIIQAISHSFHLTAKSENAAQPAIEAEKTPVSTSGGERAMPEFGVSQVSRSVLSKSVGGSSVRTAEQIGRFLAQPAHSGSPLIQPARTGAKTAEHGAGHEESSATANSNPETNDSSVSKTEEKANDFERLVATMRLRLGARRSTARLELHPPELGRLLVQVRMDQESVNIDVHTETEEAKTRIAERATELALALQKHGIRVARLEVVRGEAEGKWPVESGQRPRGGTKSGAIGKGLPKSDSRLDSQTARGRKSVEQDEESWLVFRGTPRMDLMG